MLKSHLLLLLQIERSRQQPDGFQQLLRAAIQDSTTKLGGDPPMCWRWVECDSCKQWRLVSDTACYMMGLDPDATDGASGVQFHCGANEDRLGGQGCQEPAEWAESA